MYGGDNRGGVRPTFFIGLRRKSKNSRGCRGMGKEKTMSLGKKVTVFSLKELEELQDRFTKAMDWMRSMMKGDDWIEVVYEADFTGNGGGTTTAGTSSVVWRPSVRYEQRMDKNFDRFIKKVEKRSKKISKKWSKNTPKSLRKK